MLFVRSSLHDHSSLQDYQLVYTISIHGKLTTVKNQIPTTLCSYRGWNAHQIQERTEFSPRGETERNCSHRSTSFQK